MGRNEAAQGTVPLLSIRNIYKSFGLNAVLKGISLYILPGEVLALIGGNMIKESLTPEEDSCDASVAFKDMVILALATSIDALAVGVTFAFLRVPILPAVSFIGVTTFLLSIAGVKVGNIFGAKYKAKAEFAGGVILILMGIKILVEHVFF